MEKAKKLVVWQNYDVDPADWEDFFNEFYPDSDEDERWQMALEQNWDYLDDERMNLDVDLPGQIVVVGTLGLWNGRVSGYKLEKAKNLNGCLDFMKDCEYAEWYVEDGEFCSRQSHHDGTNYVTYRLLPDSTSDEIWEKVKYGDCTSEDLMGWTESLAPYVCKVYGWEYEKEGAAA